MELRAFRYLKAVVEAGSFAAAAARLGMSSSNLTRQISSLENELGLTLLERSRTGTRLTSGGATVMIEVRRMLNDLDAVATAARANGVGKCGEFRLGLRIPPVGDRLRTLLRQWRVEHPDVSITVHELPDYELSNAVLRRTLDVAFFAAYGVLPNLPTAPLVRERIFAAIPQDHPLAAQDTICWRDLRDEAIRVQDWESSHATREFYASLIGIGLPLRSHPASKQSVLALVAAGFGLTLVLESQAQVMVPGVAYRRILEENAKVDIVLAWAPEAEDAAIGCFVSFMRDHAPLSRVIASGVR
jgi:DNA-binding transcriptional LysR family regulator